MHNHGFDPKGAKKKVIYKGYDWQNLNTDLS